MAFRGLQDESLAQGKVHREIAGELQMLVAEPFEDWAAKFKVPYSGNVWPWLTEKPGTVVDEQRDSTAHLGARLRRRAERGSIECRGTPSSSDLLISGHQAKEYVPHQNS